MPDPTPATPATAASAAVASLANGPAQLPATNAPAAPVAAQEAAKNIEATTPAAEPPKPTESKLKAIKKAAYDLKVETQKRMAAEAFATQKTQWETTQAETIRKASIVDQAARLYQEDPSGTKVMEFLGLDFRKIDERKLQGDERSPAQVAEEAANKRIRDWETAQADKQKAAEQKAQDEADKRAITAAKQQLEEIAKAEPDRYELVNAVQRYGIQRTWEIIDEYNAETGQVLDFREAMDAAEEELFEAQQKIQGGKKALSIREQLDKAKAEAEAKAKAAAAPARATFKTGFSQPVAPRAVGSNQTDSTQTGSQTAVLPSKQNGITRPYNPAAHAHQLREWLLKSRDN